MDTIDNEFTADLLVESYNLFIYLLLYNRQIVQLRKKLFYKFILKSKIVKSKRRTFS